jgi:hypothetical protein
MLDLIQFMDDYKSTHDARLRPGDWVGRLVRYWPQLISLISSFATIIGLIIAVFSVNDKATLSVIYAVELSAFSLFLMGYVIFQEYRFSRKARYAEALYSIHSCVHFLRDYQFDQKLLTNTADCQRQLSKVVTSLANSFSLVTGTHCRACIKMLEFRNISQDEYQKLPDNKTRLNYLFVSTFCRDEITTTASVNKAENKDKYTHHVIGNTDFRELYLDVNKRIFFCNDIQACGGDYQNSSTQTGQKISYRSVITWPIRKLVYRQDKDDAGKFNEDQDILGFLCVDSARRNIFREDYDREMGAIVADSLFVFLKKYHDYFPIK